MEIYILLTDTGTLLTRMIKSYTKYSFNHSSISFDRKLNEVYSFGRKNANNPFFAGFVKENMQDRIFKNAYCAVYSFTVTELQYELMQVYIRKMKKNELNYKYNFIGLFGILFHKKIERQNAFFCSQFIVTLLDFAGISIVNKPAFYTTPEDLTESPLLTLQFKGRLSDYLVQSQEHSNSTILIQEESQEMLQFMKLIVNE